MLAGLDPAATEPCPVPFGTLFTLPALELRLECVFACLCMSLPLRLHLCCFCVYTGLHLHLHRCSHAACFALVLHLGCTCACMLCPIRVSEGDVEDSALALAPACCGVRGQMLLVAIDLVSACICTAWNCIATSCIALNLVQLHLLALQLRNGCRCLAK